MSGVRLILDSKSSVPPVDCHTHAGWEYPSYHTFPNSVLSVISGCGLLTVHCASLPAPSTATTASFLAAKLRADSTAPSLLTRRSVSPEVPYERWRFPARSAVAKLLSRFEAVMATTAAAC